MQLASVIKEVEANPSSEHAEEAAFSPRDNPTLTTRLVRASYDYPLRLELTPLPGRRSAKG